VVELGAVDAGRVAVRALEDAAVVEDPRLACRNP
jgi:hypothetical protein